MTATRKDVAELAGTSPAVVSYVLNDGPRSVAPDTKERVLAAVQQLGYRPNGIARSLRMSRTMTFGLVVPDNSNPFFAELARAIEEAAFSAGYTLLVGNATDDEERQTTYVRTFLDKQVDGLIVIPAHASLTFLDELNTSGVPWVVADRDIPNLSDVPRVLVDNYEGARLATSHLVQHNHRQIACIAGPSDAVPAPTRAAGWRAALAEYELQPAESALQHVPFGRYAGYQAAFELFAKPDRPSAVFVASDEQTFGVLRAISEVGLRCPDDVAVAAFDGIAASAYANPALTTMRQPVTDLGIASVQALVSQIVQPDLAPSTTVLPATLVARGSCGCPDPPGGWPAEHESTDRLHAEGQHP